MRFSNFKTGLLGSGAIALISACVPSTGEPGTAQQIKGEAVIPAADGSETLGYAFSYFWFAIHESPEDCPEGLAMALRDVAIMDFPEAKQKYLLWSAPLKWSAVNVSPAVSK